MNRRDALAGMAVLGTVVSRSVRAQATTPGRVRTVGLLSIQPEPEIPPAQRPLAKALAGLGWHVGKNLVIDEAYAEWKPERLKELAAQLVRKRVDILFAHGPEAMLAAARATQSIPVVFNQAVWPVEQGLIESFRRPGRNLTGTTYYTGVEVSNKRLEFLREIAPAARRLAWLWPPDYAETLGGGRFDMEPVLESAARALGFQARFFQLRNAEDIETAFEGAAAWRAQALTASGPQVFYTREKVATLALRQRLPSAFIAGAIVEAGGLLSYGPPMAEVMAMTSRAAAYVDRILRGANPAELPVDRPRNYELVVNAKTAKALGIAIPQSILLRADRVIE
jgi:putative tryptophan/tyrosine transport system substrate-binding protein